VDLLSIFQGLKLFDASYIRNLIVIGDLTLVIKLMHGTSSLSDGKLVRIVHKYKRKLSGLKSTNIITS
jgi:hypothetical protein